jgi:hypothetical protein
MVKSKTNIGEIKEIVEPTLYKIIVIQIEKIGIAIVNKNYVVFEEKVIDKEIIHVTIGYYGNRSFNHALNEVSAILLKNRLARKCRTEAIELVELRRIIDSHIRKFDILVEGLEVDI